MRCALDAELPCNLRPGTFHERAEGSQSIIDRNAHLSDRLLGSLHGLPDVAHTRPALRQRFSADSPATLFLQRCPASGGAEHQVIHELDSDHYRRFGHAAREQPILGARRWVATGMGVE
jgi:hypothetical protein